MLFDEVHDALCSLSNAGGTSQLHSEAVLVPKLGLGLVDQCGSGSQGEQRHQVQGGLVADAERGFDLDRPVVRPLERSSVDLDHGDDAVLCLAGQGDVGAIVIKQSAVPSRCR
jgi:hypothetical protein